MTTDYKFDLRVYAALVLLICFTLNVVGGGLFQTFSVFLLPIMRDFQVDKGALSAVVSFTLVTSGLMGPFAGTLFDRFGPLKIYGAGLCLLAMGYYMASQADNVIGLYVTLGLMIGLGNSMIGGVPHAALVSRWFKERSGVAMGVIFSAGGISILIWSPTSQLLIDTQGWRATYVTFSIVLICLLPVLFFIPWRQILQGHPNHAAPKDETLPAEEVVNWTLPRALRTSSFWGLFSVYFFTGGCTVGLSIHMVSYLISADISPLEAATAFGISGSLAPLGMIGFGYLGDLIGRARTAKISYVLTALSIIGLYFVKHPLPTDWHSEAWILGFSIFCFGVTSGSRGPMVSSLCMQIFSGARIGGIYGSISLGGGLGSAFGAWQGGLLQDIFGTSDALLAFSMVFLLIGGTPFLFIKNLSSR